MKMFVLIVGISTLLCIVGVEEKKDEFLPCAVRCSFEHDPVCGYRFKDGQKEWRKFMNKCALKFYNCMHRLKSKLFAIFF